MKSKTVSNHLAQLKRCRELLRDEQLTADQLAAKLGCDEKTARTLLNDLRSLGALVKSHARYGYEINPDFELGSAIKAWIEALPLEDDAPTDRGTLLDEIAAAYAEREGHIYLEKFDTVPAMIAAVKPPKRITAGRKGLNKLKVIRDWLRSPR